MESLVAHAIFRGFSPFSLLGLLHTDELDHVPFPLHLDLSKLIKVFKR